LSSRSPDHDPHRTIYYLGYPLGRFAGLKHRQLARQVGVIITTGRIRRTLVNKINLLVDSPRSIETSRLAPVKSRIIFPTPRVQLLQHLARLVVDYFDYAARPGASEHRVAHLLRSSSTTSPVSHVRVPRHVAQLVVDYFPYAACPGASARRDSSSTTWLHRAARRVSHLADRRRLLPLRRTSRCLGTSRGSSSTTLPTPRVRVPRHVARLVTRLVVDYFTYAAHPVVSARRAACCVTHR
jgi:hypothetical protein